MVDFPTHTVILINIAMVATGLIIWFMLSETLKRLDLSAPVKRNWRWGAALVLSLWLIVRTVLSFNPPNGQILGTQVTVGFVTFGIVVGTLPLTLSPTFRQIVHATPATWIIGIHTVRVVGALFLTLLDMKLLPPEFAIPAGYGDVTVALLALVVVYLLATNSRYARTAALIWNVLGIVDFIAALVTGTVFIPPFVGQFARSGVDVQYLNHVLMIPTYGVPLIATLHVYSLHQLLRGNVSSPQRNV